MLNKINNKPMQAELVSSPSDLVNFLSILFPQFEEEWVLDEPEDKYSFHSVLSTFCPMSHIWLENADKHSLKKFCDLVNLFVERGNEYENTISTGLLEHASQIGIKKILKPHLSALAKLELR
jgi:hypothetical protein